MPSHSASAMLSRITAAAKALGLNRRELAIRAGVSPETVSRIATRGTCDFATIGRLARAAGLGIALEAGEATGQGRDAVFRKQSVIRSLATAHGVRKVSCSVRPHAATTAWGATCTSWSSSNPGAACST